MRSKEFGASGARAGYNQLLFDDTDSQGRIQLKSSHAASELNLGHLIHSADNYRGGLRGNGAELRTDTYGAVRAGVGVLITSYKGVHGAERRDPAGDNAPGIAMLKQAVQLAETFNAAAATHKTVGLAGHLGAAKATSSTLDEKAAPLQALLTAVSGMVGQDSLDAAQADAGDRNTSPGEGKLPHSTDAIIAISAKDGLGVIAGQDLQFANGETITLMSGNDTQFITGGQLRVHSGQAIGVLGGAVKAGEDEIGVQLVAAKETIDVQAQADTLSVEARDEVNVKSANAHIDWAAAKSISISTAGGANITIDGGNITVQCPGKITVHAGKKSFTGPDKMTYPVPPLPRVALPVTPVKFDMQITDVPGPSGVAIPYMPWRLVKARSSNEAFGVDKFIVEGETDGDGQIALTANEEKNIHEAYAKNPNDLWLVYAGQAKEFMVTVSKDDWTDHRKLYYALDAMGYSDNLYITDDNVVDDFHGKLAFDNLKSTSGAALFKKINGK